jgi:hypothetical protein
MASGVMRAASRVASPASTTSAAIRSASSVAARSLANAQSAQRGRSSVRVTSSPSAAPGARTFLRNCVKSVKSVRGGLRHALQPLLRFDSNTSNTFNSAVHARFASRCAWPLQGGLGKRRLAWDKADHRRDFGGSATLWVLCSRRDYLRYSWAVTLMPRTAAAPRRRAGGGSNASGADKRTPADIEEGALPRGPHRCSVTVQQKLRKPGGGRHVLHFLWATEEVPLYPSHAEVGQGFQLGDVFDALGYDLRADVVSK